jgi:hypothetical protein
MGAWIRLEHNCCWLVEVCGGLVGLMRDEVSDAQINVSVVFKQHLNKLLLSGLGVSEVSDLFDLASEMVGH